MHTPILSFFAQNVKSAVKEAESEWIFTKKRVVGRFPQLLSCLSILWLGVVAV